MTAERGGRCAWASEDFFPGEGKNFPGGTRTYFLPKRQRKRYYFSPKSLKTYYFWLALAGQGGGARAPLTLPCGRPWVCVKAIPCTASVIKKIVSLLYINFIIIFPSFEKKIILWVDYLSAVCQPADRRLADF
jgi:hypothetical protein